MQGAEIDFDQHRDNHDSNQQPYRQVDLGHLNVADDLEQVRQPLAKGDTDHDAQADPQHR